MLFFYETLKPLVQNIARIVNHFKYLKFFQLDVKKQMYVYTFLLLPGKI